MWKVKYEFTLQPRRLDEFSGMCHLHQTSPESHFTGQRLCSVATIDGRITLSDYKLIVTRKDDREEQMLASEHEWGNALRNHFGMVLR